MSWPNMPPEFEICFYHSVRLLLQSLIKCQRSWVSYCYWDLPTQQRSLLPNSISPMYINAQKLRMETTHAQDPWMVSTLRSTPTTSHVYGSWKVSMPSSTSITSHVQDTWMVSILSSTPTTRDIRSMNGHFNIHNTQSSNKSQSIWLLLLCHTCWISWHLFVAHYAGTTYQFDTWDWIVTYECDAIKNIKV